MVRRRLIVQTEKSPMHYQGMCWNYCDVCHLSEGHINCTNSLLQSSRIGKVEEGACIGGSLRDCTPILPRPLHGSANTQSLSHTHTVAHTEASQQVAQAQQAEGKETLPERSTDKEPAHMKKACAVNDKMPESSSESRHAAPEEEAEGLMESSPKIEDLKDPKPPLRSHHDNITDSSMDFIPPGETTVEEMPQEKCEIQGPLEEVVPCKEAEVQISSNDSEQPSIKPEETDTVSDKDGILGRLMEVVPVSERQGEDTAPQQFTMPEALKEVILVQEDQVQKAPTSLARVNLSHSEEEAPPERLMLETSCEPCVAANIEECTPHPGDLAVHSLKKRQDATQEVELRPESNYLENAGTKPKELESFIDSGDKADTADTSMKASKPTFQQ